MIAALASHHLRVTKRVVQAGRTVARVDAVAGEARSPSWPACWPASASPRPRGARRASCWPTAPAADDDPGDRWHRQRLDCPDASRLPHAGEERQAGAGLPRGVRGPRHAGLARSARSTRGPYSFLLESVEGGETWGRYSLLGSRPSLVFIARGDRCEIRDGDQVTQGTRHPLEELDALLEQHQAVPLPGPAALLRRRGRLPRLRRGALVRAACRRRREDDQQLPGRGVPVRRRGERVRQPAPHAQGGDARARRQRPGRRLRGGGAASRSRGGASPPGASVGGAGRGGGAPAGAHARPPPASSIASAVEQAKERIRAGDIFQVVLSHRMSTPVTRPAFEAYRALRVTNPSPYMYFLRLGDLSLVGLVARGAGAPHRRRGRGAADRGHPAARAERRGGPARSRRSCAPAKRSAPST